MKYILYNPNAKSHRAKEIAESLTVTFEGNCKKFDITTIENYRKFISTLTADDEIYIVGGDGTINRIANELDGIDFAPNSSGIDVTPDIYLCEAGTGNDFMNDVSKYVKEGVVKVDGYIKDLPKVTVNGTEKLFINGVGFGLDGMCCQIGDELRAKSDKPVNYTAIAIKQCLFGFKPKKAKVTVDGVEYNFDNVWIAPTMKGKFYGGGMKVAPDQDRLNKDKTVSVVIFYGSNRIKTLMIFPKIFKGEHVKYTNNVKVLTGHEITVEFNEPTALQIDGDTVKNVKSYSVSTRRNEIK